jgi:hypothetical protein
LLPHRLFLSFLLVSFSDLTERVSLGAAGTMGTPLAFYTEKTLYVKSYKLTRKKERRNG